MRGFVTNNKSKKSSTNSKKSKNKKGRRKKISLDGSTWIKYSISVWRISKSPDEKKLKHQAMFPLELPRRLIEIYTHKGDIVLDPFLGIGTTVLAAKELGRRGIGFELNELFAEQAQQRVASQLPFEGVEEPKIHNEDSRKILEFIKPETVDFIVTSPPYWDIHRQRRTADYKEAKPYSEAKNDLGNINDYYDFLNELKDVFGKAYQTLKPDKYCAVIVMDLRKEKKFYPFHIDVTSMMTDIGFELIDIIIWDRQQEYNNLRPLGYPYVFVVNKIHEYILLFKKK